MGKRRLFDINEYVRYNSQTNKSTCLVENCKKELSGNRSANIKRHYKLVHKRDVELDPVEHLDEDGSKDFHGDDDSDEDFEDIETPPPPPPPPENASRAALVTLPQPQRPLKVRKLSTSRTDDSSVGALNSHNTNRAPDENSRDESVIFGEYVGQKLRNFDSRSRAIAIHHINGILFNAEMGQYKHSFLDVSGGLQIQPQRTVNMPTSNSYFFGRPEPQTHLVLDSTSSVNKQIHSKNVQPAEVSFLNGTTSEDQDEVELKVLEQNELYNS